MALESRGAPEAGGVYRAETGRIGAQGPTVNPSDATTVVRYGFQILQVSNSDACFFCSVSCATCWRIFFTIPFVFERVPNPHRMGRLRSFTPQDSFSFSVAFAARQSGGKQSLCPPLRPEGLFVSGNKDRLGETAKRYTIDAWVERSPVVGPQAPPPQWWSRSGTPWPSGRFICLCAWLW